MPNIISPICQQKENIAGINFRTCFIKGLKFSNFETPRIHLVSFRFYRPGERLKRGSDNKKRLTYRPSALGRSGVGLLVDQELWKWVKISAFMRGTTISTFVESILLMYRAQEEEWNGIIDRYIDSLIEPEAKKESKRKP